MLGLPINIFAFCYCFFVIVFFCIPIEVPVTLAAAKRAPTVWAGVICIALAVYVLHERYIHLQSLQLRVGKLLGLTAINLKGYGKVDGPSACDLGMAIHR